MSDLNNQEKLEEVYTLTLENNKILRSIRKQQNVEAAFKIFYWLIILGVIGGTYVYVRPIVDSFLPNTKVITDLFDTLKEYSQTATSTGFPK